ncbi:CDP-diacylglycerol--glycerol-3-phosphate 3-phosphatidyltransferase [Verrucomicrobiia bacterium DG1235]|nr:CDP-diacylglycerol--glycerol-3-phosphate 3-phosphatidyltransferase [Verrucomicrobiae bacterium DG1235]
MNLPNLLTLSRIPMMFVIVWLMRESFTGAASLAFALFVIAGITDWLDGYFARKLNQVSNFGILMDALTDKILMLGLMVALVERGVENDGVRIFLVLLILGREFMITGLRLVAATKGVVMAAESAGKQKTVTQIIAVGGLLLATVFKVDLVLAGLPYAAEIGYWVAWIGRVFFWLCVVMTLYSGAKYFRKYGDLAFKN